MTPHSVGAVRQRHARRRRAEELSFCAPKDDLGCRETLVEHRTVGIEGAQCVDPVGCDRQERPGPVRALRLILLLNLLRGPSHAYRLYKLLQQTGKDRVLNVKTRASVYQTIDRLVRDGLIEPTGTSSTAGYPDRVEYAITDKGRTAAAQWLRELLASTGTDITGFTVALSVMFALTPDDAARQLRQRREQIIGQLAQTEQAIHGPGVPAGLPRLFLLDEHYRHAVLTTELAFTEALIDDLANGNLSWAQEWIDEIAARFTQAD